MFLAEKKLTSPQVDAILDAAKQLYDDSEEGREFRRKNFPLVVYQTGSGTQTNMNVNEVLANVANL